MSVNKYMHPRNIYRTPPNFKQMAIDYPEFRKYVKQEITGKIKIDFKDNETLKSLTQTLLKKDFDLDVVIPSDRLIPTVPLRLNYILWIEDLLSITQETEKEKFGIDIGTGASCIYPLLSAKKNKWHMLGTEIEPESLATAQENINRNNLTDLIQVKQATIPTFLKQVIDCNIVYDFCMCNPPFFASTNELDPRNNSRTDKRPLPRNAQTGQQNEIVVSGGEVEFISNLIKESVDLRNQINIFTTMVGKKSSTIPLKFLLRQVEVVSFKQTEFHQGHTTRWGLAWTFQNIDLRKVPVLQSAKKKAKPPLKYILPKPKPNMISDDLDSVVQKIRLMLQTLQMTYDELKKNQFMFAFQVVAQENTWSHQRRKRREQLKLQRQLQTDLNSSDEFMDVDSVASSQSSGQKRGRDDVDDSDSEYFDAKKSKNFRDDVVDVYLKFNLIVRKLGDEFHLEMSWVEGTAGRDCVYQVMQYFKNKYV